MKKNCLFTPTPLSLGMLCLSLVLTPGIPVFAQDIPKLPDGVEFFPKKNPSFTIPEGAKYVPILTTYEESNQETSYSNNPQNNNNYTYFNAKKIGETTPIQGWGGTPEKPVPIYTISSSSINNESGGNIGGPSNGGGLDGPVGSPVPIPGSGPGPGGDTGTVTQVGPGAKLSNPFLTITNADSFLFIPNTIEVSSNVNVFTEDEVTNPPIWGSSSAGMTVSGPQKTWTEYAYLSTGMDHQTKIGMDGISFMGKNYITTTGLNAQGNPISQVAPGRIAADSTDAVNGSQLWALEQRLTQPSLTPIYRVGAMSAALSGLHPLPFNPKHRFNLMAAYGNYKTENALAVGLSYYIKPNLRINSGVSFINRHDSMFNIGMAYRFGGYDEDSDFIMRNELQHRTDEVKKLQAKLDHYEQKNADFEKRLNELQAALNALKKAPKKH